MSTVLHYVPRWLPLSEHFVHAQISRSRHRPVVVVREEADGRSLFRVPHLHSLAALRRAPERVRRAVLIAIASAYRARLVHTHFGYHLHDVLGIVRRRRLPLVVSLHGHDATAFARAYPHHYAAALEKAAAVIVPSEFLARRAAELGARAGTVRVLPAGVDTSWFSPTPLPEGPPTALFVGRFVEKKGLDVLARAWPEVRRRVPDARLRLLGPGSPDARFATLAPGVDGVEADVARPEVRAHQVRTAMRQATVVVSPSHTAADGDADTLVLVNLEAQASARPVITTDHGGIPEYVEAGRTALVVAQGDARELAGALVSVLTDRGLASRLGAAGPAWARRFDVGPCAAAVDDVYDELLASPSSPS